MQLLDLEMRRYIILLLITGNVWAQTEIDTLVLNDKTVYTGVLIRFGNDEILFRALPSAKLSINISDIQNLKLSDGTSVIENGIVVASNEKHIKKISYSRYLSVVKAEKVNISKTILGCCIVIIVYGLMALYGLKDFKLAPWPEKGP